MFGLNLFEIILISFLFLLAIPILRALYFAPFVPTPQKTVNKMLTIAKIQPKQIIYDLGCGDGRFIRSASRQYKAKTIGLELNPFLYFYAKLRSFGHQNELILFQNLFQQDLSQANLIICYLLPHTLQKLEKKLLTELSKGTKIISHGFCFKHLQPIHTFLPTQGEHGKIYLFEI